MGEITLKLLDVSDEQQQRFLFEVRSHPEVAKYFFAPPPSSYSNHLQFLSEVIRSKKRIFFIVSLREMMCGYCQLTNHLESIELGLAFLPEYWGFGLGNIAVEFLINYVRSFSKKRMVLQVQKDNHRAIALYRKFGFSPCKIYRNNLKNREYDKEAAQIFASGASGHCLWQGASEEEKFAAKPTQLELDPSGYFGIDRVNQQYWMERRS